MCGIAGFASYDQPCPVQPEQLAEMTRLLAHRGPDDAGLLQIAPGFATLDGRPLEVPGGTRSGLHAGLGHRRLSILDLSPAGHNPLANEDGSIWITYNGEVYNFGELRVELERAGHRFRSRTDTECLVHLYEDHGDDLVHRLRGMYAFALLDLRRGRLLLARDRLGKKPLFWTAIPGSRTLLFGSEAKSLLAALPRRPELDPDALDQLLTFGYIPAPDTLFAGIYALPPGHLLAFDGSGMPDPRPYWSPADHVAREAPAAPGEGPLEDQFLARFEEAVRMRMVADVPVGAFLSGGIDSSLVVAAMARAGTGPVRTYAIGFDAPEWDERPHALRVARHFRTEHRELVVRPADVEETLQLLVRHSDEGFADSSMLPTYFVSRLAREEVKVALSGDGGDELFAGYTHYLGERLARQLARLPVPLRKLLPPVASALARMPGLPGRGTLRRVARVLRDSGAPMPERFLLKRSLLREPERLALYRPEFAARLTGRPRAVVRGFHAEVAGCPDFVRQIACMDLRFYLPHDMLMKVDHASMACSLEVRTPFLDHPLVEFALSLPASAKIQGWTTKVLLRRLARRLLPPGIAERRKQGFGVPLSAWFRDDLATFAQARLCASGARISAFLRPEAVEALLARHAAGAADAGHGVWTLLCLETWLGMFG